MSALAGGILSFGELHGAVVTRGHADRRHRPDEGSLEEWADGVSRSSGRRAAGCPGIGHRWHEHDLRAERLLDVATTELTDGRHAAAVRALAARVAAPRRSSRGGEHRRGPGGGPDGRSGSTPSTATSCSPSRGASGSRPTSSRSARGSGPCASSIPRPRSMTASQFPAPLPGDEPMKVRLISPFDDAEQIWIGLDEPGMRRKVFRFVSPETGSEEFMAGITIFEPGEASSYHVHPESEEINLVLGGLGPRRLRGRGGGVRPWRRDVGPEGRLPPAQEHGHRAAEAPLGLHPAGGAPQDVGPAPPGCPGGGAHATGHPRRVAAPPGGAATVDHPTSVHGVRPMSKQPGTQRRDAARSAVRSRTSACWSWGP